MDFMCYLFFMTANLFIFTYKLVSSHFISGADGQTHSFNSVNN